MMIESFRLFVTVLCFGFAAYSDVQTRSVSNWLWVVFGVFGTLLQLYSGLGRVFGSIIVSVFFAFLFWFLKGFGGADSKALMTLSLLMPMGFDGSVMFFPLVVFVFGVLSAAPALFYYAVTKKDLKKVELPFLLYLLIGLLVSLFAGKWFIGLIV